MKLYKYLFVAAALLMSACTEDALDDLTGMYPAPDTYTIASATNAGSEKDGGKRFFSVDFTTTSGDKLAVKFVGDQYYLQAAAFTPAESAASAKKGNYITSESTFTRNGGSPVTISKGILTVDKDEDNYTVKGSLWLTNGDIVKVNGGGTLVYEPDPEALKLTKCLSVSVSEGLVSLQLAQEEVEAVPNAWGGVDIAGSGKYLKVDFYSANGDLVPGIYTPADNDKMGEFNYARGYDPGDIWGIGMEFKNWGTAWMEAGVEVGQNITEGDFEVKKSGNTYTITYDHNGLWFEFKGEIAGLGGGQSGEVEPEYIELTKVLSAVDNNANGTKSVTLNLGTDGIETTPNAWGGMDYTGDGNYLAIDLYSTDGKINAGTYKPADANAMSEYTYGMGWDPGDMWGIGIEFKNWGTCWMEAGVEYGKNITEGDINVAVDGDNITITYNHNGLAFRFRGTIEGMGGVAGGGETPGTPEVEYIEISNFLSAAVNNGTTLSLQLAGDGITTTPNMWGGVDVTGDGNYLKIDLYTTDGTLAEGTYTPVESSALAEGNFAMGYDPGDLWGIGIEFKNWGTAWMTREGGNETGVNIIDGTITVEKSGDNYIISLQSSAVNVRYTGPINL